MREDAGEAAHVPEYYAGHHADFWFRLFDIRRLVSDDTPAVIEEAGKLRNVGYHDRPVSLYGGMVDLPLLVHREPEARWFSDRDALTEGGLWAERAAALRSDTERMSRELRDNLFGRDLWAAMEPATRSFLASAEAVFRARRDDPGFDLSGVAVEYAKAVETELNALVFPALKKAFRSRPPAEREVRVVAEPPGSGLDGRHEADVWSCDGEGWPPMKGYWFGRDLGMSGWAGVSEAMSAEVTNLAAPMGSWPRPGDRFIFPPLRRPLPRRPCPGP